MKFDDYWSGVDKEPLRQEMTPDDQFNDHSAQMARKSTFLNKLGQKPQAEPIREAVVQQVVQQKEVVIQQNPDQQREIDELLLKISALNDELSQHKQTNWDLQE